jgi:hypothetical protein
MPLTHEVARAMARDGACELTQRGAVCEPAHWPVRGPYRVRLAAAAAAAAAGGGVL